MDGCGGESKPSKEDPLPSFPAPPHTAETCRRTAVTMTHCRASEGEDEGGRGGGRQRRSNLECASEGKFLFRLLRRTHAGDAGSLLPSITHQSRGLDGQTELLHCVPIMISQSPRIPAPESPAGFAG